MTRRTVLARLLELLPPSTVWAPRPALDVDAIADTTRHARGHALLNPDHRLPLGELRIVAADEFRRLQREHGPVKWGHRVTVTAEQLTEADPWLLRWAPDPVTEARDRLRRELLGPSVPMVLDPRAILRLVTS